MPAKASVAVVTLFAPFDDTTTAYLDFLRTARRSVFICIYGFTLAPLVDTLIAQHQAGLRVSLILDHSQAAGVAERAQVARLIAAGVPFCVGVSPVHGQILHSKFTVIDERAVESGSWNYSLSAASQSNTVSFVEDADYARAYLEHFHRLWGFIHLHKMTMQPKGEVMAEDVPAADLPPDAAADVSSIDAPMPPVAAAVPLSAPAVTHSSLAAGDAHSSLSHPGSAPPDRQRPRASTRRAAASSSASSRAATRASAHG